MAQPTPYRPSFDFTDAGGATPPGVPLDNELFNIARTFSDILRNLSLIQRDDAGLRNGIVGVDALSPQALALVTSGTFRIAGPYEAGASYKIGDFLSQDGAAYLTMVDHTSASLEASLADGSVIKIFETELATRARDEFTGNGIATDFGLSQDVAAAADVEVFVDGELQLITAYTVTGSTLSFAVAPDNSAKITVLSLTWATTPPLASLVTMVQQGANQLALATGSLIKTTWPELEATEGTEDQKAVVLTGGIGTHTDPVTDETVKNTGFYQCTEPPYGWERVAPLQGELTGDDVLAAAADVSANAAIVGSDRATVAADKALTLGYRNEAAGFADDAESAAIAAAAAGKKYTTTGEGEADTVDGEYFVTPVAGGLAIWENVSGTATAWPAAAPDQVIIATSEALAAAVADVQDAADTIGVETGNPSVRAALGGVADDAVSLRGVTLYGVREQATISNRLMSSWMALMWRTVRFIGHSAVQGSGVVSAGATVNPRSGINGSIPRHLEYLLQQTPNDHQAVEWRVTNRGQSAQTSAEIAARMGALPILITLASGTSLASSGASTCTVSPTPYGPSSRRGTSIDEYYGTIGGQRCVLLNTGTGPNANSPIYTIEQISGTGPITINPGTPFILDFEPQDFAINIFWATRNDNNNELSWAMQAAMIDKLPQDERRFIVMGDWPAVNAVPSEDLGDTRHTNILAENAEFKVRYGANFFDIYAFLRGDYPYDGSLYRSIWQMTGEDINQASNDWPDQAAGEWKTTGRIPRRWYSIHLGGSDKTHFNEQTYYWLAFALIEFFFAPKGWLRP